MTAAERLFAEQGLVAVSNRQISEAAGLGNNTAVSYHFGSKSGLVRAIMRDHADATERIRERRLAQCSGSADLRDWVGCLVRPSCEHMAELGVPSWHGRFAVQAMADPVLRAIAIDEALERPPLRRALAELADRLTAVPLQVRAERADMARHLILQTCAERERALADGAATRHPSWTRTADTLTDAVVGLFLAPVTARP
ncbi:MULTISPECIES: TetR/AcrR family transcriptional regulator [unclassified Streptomyces]|uniref:TetR/AcrR family transcriptional regulator n=1 Tax=unclassified Streptomyces TaxID=2593676 RepID=UPI0036F13591